MAMRGRWLTRANGVGCLGLLALALVIAAAVWCFMWLVWHYQGGAQGI